MSSAGIRVSVTGGVASVSIDNPGQRNALTRSMCLELQNVMPRLDADPQVAVVTLRGVGGTFCSGVTINDLASVLLDHERDGTAVDQLSRADLAITSLTTPTVAVVDGACMGGGWQIASACDFIIASERSRFAITPAKIGIIYPRPGIERLVRLVGPANAKLILFSGEAFTAVRAQALGLVAETVPDDDFERRCGALIAAVLSRSRFSTHHLKRLVDLTGSAAPGDPGLVGPAGTPDLDQAWEDAWAAMVDGPDMEIGIDAFINRAQPEFTWRRP